MAEDVLAVRRWWLERWLMVACRLVKKVAVCQSVGSSALRKYFQRNLRVLICCVDFLLLWLRQLMEG